MKAGIIGVPRSGTIGQVESADEVKERYQQEFHTTLEVQRVEDLAGNTKFVEGTALKEEPEDREVAEVEEKDGRHVIRIHERTRKKQVWAGFVTVEARNGHDGFVAVSTSEAEFVFDVVGRLAGDGAVVDRANLALGDFVTAKDGFTLESGGGPTGSVNAETLMTWGDRVDQDDRLGPYVQGAVKSNTVPIVSGSYVWDGHGVHCNVAASGWVEVWAPDWVTAEWLDWVESEVVPFVQDAEGNTGD